jgi:hypothetical protein
MRGKNSSNLSRNSLRDLGRFIEKKNEENNSEISTKILTSDYIQVEKQSLMAGPYRIALERLLEQIERFDLVEDILGSV